MKTVYCPVMGREVDGTTCLEIVLVADREMKQSILPDGLDWDESKRAACLACQYHDDIV